MKAIKLVSAERKSLHTVLVTYKYYGMPFTVEWSNVLSNGSTALYGLECNTQSCDVGLALKVDRAILNGEDGGVLEDVYLSIRDTFDAQDCEQLSYEGHYGDLLVTKIRRLPDSDGIAVNFAINDYFLIQYDAGVFSIPTGAEQYWNDEKMQDIASEHFDLDAILAGLDLKDVVEQFEGGLLYEKQKAIAQAFKDAHHYPSDWWGFDLADIYINLVNGTFGEVEACYMGDGVTNYTVEIHGSDSKTGSTAIFDIDLDDDLIADLGWK